MSAVELLSWIVAGFAGAIAHEAAHYVVWVVTGRDPKFHIWALYVKPTAGPASGTHGDRIAGAAPYLCGVMALVWAFVSSSALWAIFGLAMVQLPSRADLAAIRGDVEWISLR